MQNRCTDNPLRSCAAIRSRQYSSLLPETFSEIVPAILQLCRVSGRLNRGVQQTLTDNLPVEMPSLEQYFDRNEPLHSDIIPQSGLFAPDPIVSPRKSITVREAAKAIPNAGGAH